MAIKYISDYIMDTEDLIRGRLFYLIDNVTPLFWPRKTEEQRYNPPYYVAFVHKKRIDKIKDSKD